MTSPTVVAVIGAGASGTLAAAHLARRAAGRGAALDIGLVDPAVPGTGLAYSTTDPRHRLNVPACGMSAYPDDPDHFLRWLRRHVAGEFPAEGFAPRMHYAQYLASVLDQAAQDSPMVRVRHLPRRVIDVCQVGRRLRLTLDDGTSRPADAVVLATGHGAPDTGWAPPALVRAPQFIADPWRALRCPRPAVGEQVVLIGAGLTAVDMAQQLGREGVRVHIVSRHGMLPLPHAPRSTASAPAAPPTRRPTTLAGLRRLVFDAIRKADGDWRRAVDSLRPVTTELWQALDEPARRAFLASAVRRWDRVRHRVDPAVHAWLDQRRAEGSLVVHAACVVDAEPAGPFVRITLSDGAVLNAAAVLNCTGANRDVQRSEDPLDMNLLGSGFAQPGPLGLGYATDRAGRLGCGSGSGPAVWTIGPLRRGQLWESTAIPEIRTQAAQLADHILATLPDVPVRRRPPDRYGLPFNASSATGAL